MTFSTPCRSAQRSTLSEPITLVFPLNPTDSVVIFDGQALVCNLSAPDRQPSGNEVVVKNSNPSPLRVVPPAGHRIDGQEAKEIPQWGVLRLMTDGTQWITI
ncbi:hypothetical protein GCM10009599_20410 [Luteococcus peritonei]